MTLKLVDLNVEGNRHLPEIIPFLQKEAADIITLQEVFETNLPELEQKLKLKAYFFPLMKITKPNTFGFPLLGKIGLAFLTRLPVEATGHRYYRGKPTELPEMFSQPDAQNIALVWIKLKKNNKTYTVCTTHFVWALPEDADAKQAPYLEKLLSILELIQEFILAGDFNAPRGRKTFNQLASRYQDNVPQAIASTLDPQLHRTNRKLVVDGLFTTPEYKAKNVKIISGVSDHKAIVADIEKL